MTQRRNPAVLAALPGALALATPGVAGALSLGEAVEGVFPTPAIAFAAGLAGGALAGGVVVGVASFARGRSRARAEREAEPGDDLAQTAAGEPVRSPRHLSAGDVPQPAPEQGPVAHGPAHAASDYEQIATNYAARASFRERMAHRAAGVAATLRERMGASQMDGLPVIERADGSVGDVGTAWWDRAVGSAPAPAVSMGALASAAEAEAATIPSDFSATDADRLAAAARRAEGIARRVALVDEGPYPERRTVDDLAAVDDDWAAALRSLDERIAEQAPAQEPLGFIDVAGGAETLDEPDGLEPDTSFIPFKTPAGHPEVVDTDSYVDYLIEDEFSKNSSTAARRSSRRFLRILEGGTQASQPTSRHLADRAPRPSYEGKHFSVAEVVEA